MNEDYTVYTITPCKYCQQAKALLTSNALSFKEVHIDRNDWNAVESLLRKTGMKTFPQIFYKEKLIGGFTDLEKIEQTVGLKDYKG